MTHHDRIAVFDWGTTHLRIHVVDRDGRRLQSVAGDGGIQSLSPAWLVANFVSKLTELEATHGPLPAILLGMIGSNFGWHDVPMQPAPIAAPGLARALFAATDAGNRSCDIIPGVTGTSVIGTPDMMRGEETQVFGAMPHLTGGTGTMCLPGTHSKWVRCDGGAIAGITTAMTGEVFEFLKRQSVLRTATDGGSGQPDMVAFDEGVAVGRSGLDALMLAFSTRARSLSAEGLSPEAAESYLSGILISAEIGSMARHIGDPLLIVGAPELAALYQRSCEAHGIACRVVDGNAAVAAGARLIHDIRVANHARAAE